MLRCALLAGLAVAFVGPCPARPPPRVARGAEDVTRRDVAPFAVLGTLFVAVVFVLTREV